MGRIKMRSVGKSHLDATWRRRSSRGGDQRIVVGSGLEGGFAQQQDAIDIAKCHGGHADQIEPAIRIGTMHAEYLLNGLSILIEQFENLVGREILLRRAAKPDHESTGLRHRAGMFGFLIQS